MVPLTVDPKYPTGTIIILFIILGCLIGFGLFLYYKNSRSPVVNVNDLSGMGGNPDTSGVSSDMVWHESNISDPSISRGYPLNVSIKNVSDLDSFLTIPGRPPLKLSPGQEERITVPQGTKIQSVSYFKNGEMLKNVFSAFKTAENQTPSRGTSQTALSRQSTGVEGYEYSDVSRYFITRSGIYPDNLISRNVVLENVSRMPVLFVERDSQSGRRWGTEIVPPMSKAIKDFVGAGSTWDVVHPTDEDNPIAKITLGLRTHILLFDGKNIIAH